MAAINSTSFSLLFLAIFATLLLTSQNANADAPNDAAKSLPGINPFCMTTDRKRLCTRMVNGATNLHDATLNAINAAIDVTKKFEAVKPALEAAIDKLNNADMKKELIETCDDSFSGTVEDLELSVQLFNKGDKGGAGTRLSAALDGVCADSLKERGVQVPALDKLDGHFTKVIGNVLAVFFQT